MLPAFRYAGFIANVLGCNHALSTPRYEIVTRGSSALIFGFRTHCAASRDDLNLSSTVLVANPVPRDQQLPPATLDRVLAEAHAAAAAENIVGHDTTPFLLDFIQKATGGESLEVNINVYRNNVALGAEIARSISKR